MSVPGVDQKPVLVEGISNAVGSVRFIHLLDIQTGISLEKRFVLGLDRTVTRHSIDVANQRYTNESGQTLQPDLGGISTTVPSGGSVEYIGVPRPDVYPPPDWSHVQEPIETDSTQRPL